MTGSAFFWTRLGAIVTPFLAQVLAGSFSTLGTVSVYSVGGLLAAVAAVLLPIETAGRDLS